MIGKPFVDRMRRDREGRPLTGAENDVTMARKCLGNPLNDLAKDLVKAPVTP
jgi:hypothetical protein